MTSVLLAPPPIAFPSVWLRPRQDLLRFTEDGAVIHPGIKIPKDVNHGLRTVFPEAVIGDADLPDTDSLNARHTCYRDFRRSKIGKFSNVIHANTTSRPGYDTSMTGLARFVNHLHHTPGNHL